MKNVNNPLSFKSVLFQLLFVNLPFSPIITLASNTTKSSPGMFFKKFNMFTIDIIEKNGYMAESHKVVTDDGYILEIHRIPRSRNGQKPTRNYPVLLHHAFLSTSAEWVLSGANTSLAMQLADDGYDVWLANCRGNTYSRKHVSLPHNKRAFWDFSFHEIGTHDLPAVIDYILNKTNSQQIHYIGYSMGTMVFYIMASERPEYQPKIRSQISLAPVAYLTNMKTPLKFFVPYAKMINIVSQKIFHGSFMTPSLMTKFYASVICGGGKTQKIFCEKAFIFFTCGSDPYQFNSKLIPIILKQFPSGTSSKNVEHVAQLYTKNYFGQFDYGQVKNLQYYNSTKPPTYNLKSIQVPITLVYGDNDKLSDVKDVMRLKSELPKAMNAIRVENPYCNHVDFLWSLNVTNQVNDPIRGVLRETDEINWKYSTPNATEIRGIRDEDRKHPNNTSGRLQNPINNLNFIPGLDFIENNLDAIISSNMPRSVTDNDAMEFERESLQQKIIFGNLIKFVKHAKKMYRRFRYNENSNSIQNLVGVQNVQVETHTLNTTGLVNDDVKSGKFPIYRRNNND